MSGTLTLMPQLNGVDAAKAPAVVNIISVSSSRTHSSIKIDKDRYLSGNPIEVTVELRDENDKPVKEQKQQLNNAVRHRQRETRSHYRLERNRRWRL
ncbi:adhesin [Escherichia coli]|uniref:Adhesin n=1 Tax=Escherichia coli TaxID=562 RepID=A0A377BPI1_ECOLX|nr:adhesin [Escherichia coli]